MADISKITLPNGSTYNLKDENAAAASHSHNEATTEAAGLMSSSDKTKLNGVASGAEVNQNAFSKVKIGSSTIESDTKTDTLELVAGSNITLTPDATNDTITIAASGGGSNVTTLTLTIPTTGWNNKTISITANGVTASNNIAIFPAPTSGDGYLEAGIFCSGQASDSLTFSCETVPSAELTVNVLILG